jgi:large subunit ribosomal protein L25
VKTEKVELIMALKYSIEASKRPEGSKANSLRRENRIPATMYGHNGTESIQLTVDQKTAELLIRDAGRGGMVQLNVPELKVSTGARIQEVQTHPWKGYLYHVSFFAAKG